MADGVLRQLLRNADFVRLVGVRLIGSFGDGLLQAALASFVLFSPERQPSPLSIATAFGILLLPYSLVGPFAGVFLDRWRRRQVLARANWARAGTVLITAVVVAAGDDGLWLGLIVLATLGTGRFVLAGLSAALPHVAPPPHLVTANSAAPTAGTIIFGIGTLTGLGIRSLAGGGDHGAWVVMLATAAVYATAGVSALSMGRDQLGPDVGIAADTVPHVVRGLAQGFSVLRADRRSAHALLMMLVHRTGFGVLTVLLLLILRNTLHPSDDPDAALRDLSVIAAAVTLGALSAAVLTPVATRRWDTVRWSSGTLVAAGLVTPLALWPVDLLWMSLGSVVLGLAQQSAKIGADTTLQRRLPEASLGRAFSLLDVGVNVVVVVGALVTAIAAPADGVWPAGFLALGLLYLAAGVWYARTGRHSRHAADRS